MPAKFFGEYLLERGAISREMLAEATALEDTIARPVLALAIEKGMLNEEQIAALDAASEARAETPVHTQAGTTPPALPAQPKKMPFMELSDSALTLAEALVMKGHLRLADLQRLVNDYKKHVLQEDRQFWIYQHMRETILAGIPHKEVVSFLLQVFIDAYVAATKQTVRVLDMKENQDLRHEVDYVIMQRIIGTPSFTFAMLLSEAHALSVASAIMGEAARALDEVALDAVSEFLNMAVGNACRRLSMTGRKFAMEPPSVTTKTMMRKLLPRHCLAVRLAVPSGNFAVMFFFERAPGQK
ncbi:MAG: chemotaxis protein CheX [Kiritimatiellae bacterium]|nr:chemotaxis protein CheX [Kiritimatiellia bacterium]